jgi:hypothetical protein
LTFCGKLIVELCVEHAHRHTNKTGSYYQALDSTRASRSYFQNPTTYIEQKGEGNEKTLADIKKVLEMPEENKDFTKSFGEIFIDTRF